MSESWPHLSGRLDGDAHILPVRVYYEDTDFSSRVYHASYLRFLERGRSDVTLEPEIAESAGQLAVTDDPLIDLTRRESVDALWRAVLALPRRYREVVVLCDLEEVDYSDAARSPAFPS